MVAVIAENFGIVPLRKGVDCMTAKDLEYEISHLTPNIDGSISFKKAGFDRSTGCAYLIK